MENFRI